MAFGIITAFWACAAFFGAFCLTAWKKRVCLILCIAAGLFTLIYASGIIAEGLMIQGIDTLWNILGGFDGGNMLVCGVSYIGGLWFGDKYQS